MATAELFPPAGTGFDLVESGEDIVARSPLQLFWRRFRKDRVALVSMGFVVFLVIVAIAAPLIVKILGLPGPYVQNLNLTDEFGSPLGPSGAHPFGVDPLGQDVIARVIYGTRVSLEVGILGTAIATVIGVTLGLLAGFYRGWVDTLLSRSVDVVLSIPVLLLGLGIGAACAVRGCLGGPISPGHERDHLPDRAGQLDLHLRASCAAWCCRCASASSSTRRGRSAPRTRGSCSARSCRTWWRR